MTALLLGLLLLGGQFLGSGARREMMIAAIFDHHHQTSNIQHEIAFRHAVQMVNENRWVLSCVDIFLATCLAEGEGGREGYCLCFTIANCRGGGWQKLFFIRKQCKRDTPASNKVTLFYVARKYEIFCKKKSLGVTFQTQNDELFILLQI